MDKEKPELPRRPRQRYSLEEKQKHLGAQASSGLTAAEGKTTMTMDEFYCVVAGIELRENSYKKWHRASYDTYYIYDKLD